MKDRVIRIIGLVVGEPTEHDGRYLVDYDPSSPIHPRWIHLVTSASLHDAKRMTYEEALDVWRATDKRNPVRADGRPNRPLTAFTVEILKVEE